MKIILEENVEKLGEKGELKEVKSGYARNFLFPKNLAIPASESAIKKINEEVKKRQAIDTKTKEEAQEKAKILESKKITISVKAEKAGKLFGAISEKEIIENIKKQLGLELDPKDIEIDSPIKKVGDYKIKITLHKEIKVNVNIKVIAQK